MGAPSAFDYRRQELQEIAMESSAKTETVISDEAVTQSFLGEPSPLSCFSSQLPPFSPQIPWARMG
jgi:hypothetical protein